MYVCVNHCYGMVYIITVSWVYLTLPVHFALIHCLSPDQQLIICWIFIATYFPLSISVFFIKVFIFILFMNLMFSDSHNFFILSKQFLKQLHTGICK